MRRFIAWAVAAVATAVAVPSGLLVLLVAWLSVWPPPPSEADRARLLIDYLVEEGPPIRGSFDLHKRAIYLVVKEGPPRWFMHGIGKAACKNASALPPPYALPRWTIAVRYEGDPEPMYSCRIWDPTVPPFWPSTSGGQRSGTTGPCELSGGSLGRCSSRA